MTTTHSRFRTRVSMLMIVSLLDAPLAPLATAQTTPAASQRRPSQRRPQRQRRPRRVRPQRRPRRPPPLSRQHPMAAGLATTRQRAAPPWSCTSRRSRAGSTRRTPCSMRRSRTRPRARRNRPLEPSRWSPPRAWLSTSGLSVSRNTRSPSPTFPRSGATSFKPWSRRSRPRCRSTSASSRWTASWPTSTRARSFRRTSKA